MKAAEFRLPDENGTYHKLSDYRGKWVVLYFYPKDDTPGCTTEACGFRDALAKLQKLGVVIVGVSKDSVVSHKKFSQKYHLNFPLLSDEAKTVIRAYHAWGTKTLMGKTFEGTLRMTYLIDPTGEVRKVYPYVKPEEHASEILRDILKFQR